MHLGYERGGLLGMIVAGVCFILPAAGLTGALRRAGRSHAPALDESNCDLRRPLA
jgi:chromate transport protein ChrA